MGLRANILVLVSLCGTLLAADILVPPENHTNEEVTEKKVSDEHLTEISKFEGLDHHNGTIVINGTYTNMTIHDHINLSLGEDEERVLAGGEVKIRKKRTFCKRCFKTPSYGYGGGGGCCGQCGQCGGGGGYGGGYYRPVKIVAIPIYSGGGGGSCCRQQQQSYNPCNVCGR